MRGLVFLAALAWAPAAVAHDFWVQPEDFRPAVGASIPMTLQVGHGHERQRSQIPRRRIIRFAAIGPDGGETALEPGTLSFDTPGPRVLVLETDHGGRSVLPAARFQAYAAEEGLTPALGAKGVESSERYSRNAKAIVQVGGGRWGGAALRPVGLPLEIVPEAEPADALPIRVYYRGRPLPGALVKLTDLADDAAPRDTRRTDAQGRASFANPGAGRWLLNVVWTRPLRGEEVEFETVFSSLTFALP